MLHKDPTAVDSVIWLIVLIIASWGGFVRYLIDIKKARLVWYLPAALMQLAISGFVGLLSGFLSAETGHSIYMTFFIAGVSGAMGNIPLSHFWKKIVRSK